MILSDDDDSIYDGTGSDEYHVELTQGGTECTEDVTSDNYCCDEVDATEYCFHWKGQDEVGKGQKFYAYSSQMIKIFWQNLWPSMNTTTPFEAHKCLITDEINVSLLLKLTTAMKVMPNSQTKLR